MLTQGSHVSVNLTDLSEKFLGCYMNGTILKTHKNDLYTVSLKNCDLCVVKVAKSKIRSPIKRRTDLSPTKYKIGSCVLARDRNLSGWWQAQVIEVKQDQIKLRWKYSYRDHSNVQWIDRRNVVPEIEN